MDVHIDGILNDKLNAWILRDVQLQSTIILKFFLFSIYNHFRVFSLSKSDVEKIGASAGGFVQKKPLVLSQRRLKLAIN